MQITDNKTVSNFADKDRSRSSGRKLQAWKTESENDTQTAIYDNVSCLRSAGLFARTTEKLDTLKLCAVGSRFEGLDLAEKSRALRLHKVQSSRFFRQQPELAF